MKTGCAIRQQGGPDVTSGMNPVKNYLNSAVVCVNIAVYGKQVFGTFSMQIFYAASSCIID